MAAVEHAVSLRGDGRTRRRRIVNRAAEGVALAAALAAIAILAIVVLSVAKRGFGELSIGFLTKDLPLFGQPGAHDSGMLNIPNRPSFIKQVADLVLQALVPPGERG